MHRSDQSLCLDFAPVTSEIIKNVCPGLFPTPRVGFFICALVKDKAASTLGMVPGVCVPELIFHTRSTITTSQLILCPLVDTCGLFYIQRNLFMSEPQTAEELRPVCYFHSLCKCRL